MSTNDSRGAIDRRDELRAIVTAILATETGGRLAHVHETAAVDFKEEAGRRSGPNLEPGTPQNQAAAEKLADEVACMANSPGGGALLLGVEDGTGLILGTELDIDWLRARINQLINVAPDILAHRVGDQRVLAIYVAESPEPIEDTRHRLRWRIGDACQGVDRSEWWQHRSEALGVDAMAVASTARPSDVRPGAIAFARRQAGFDEPLSNEEFLRRIGALRSDGYLSQAGKLLFTKASRRYLEFTVAEVHGGRVINTVIPEDDASLLEQLSLMEEAVTVANSFALSERGLSQQPRRRVPPIAIREAMLNGLIHRDWNRSEVTEIKWTELDSTLEVRSPGGFAGGVTKDTVLSQRYARYPALADVFRALGMVEKQGYGVDRMYQAMIAHGHRPPLILEGAGPSVTCTLVGGAPVMPILELIEGIRPEPRQRDARIAIILDGLLRLAPFITEGLAAAYLQTDPETALIALDATAQSSFRGEPLIRRHRSAWLLGRSAWRHVQSRRAEADPYLWFASTDFATLEKVAKAWIAHEGAITTGDMVELTGISRGTARRYLDHAVDAETLTVHGAGRSTHYLIKE